MLLLGHAAVSARRGPRGTCQETRAALWAPAECGVTARSASDGVDVNGIRVHHRRLQYRRYQCGVSAKVSPQILLRLRPRIVWADEGRSWSGIPSPSLFRGFAAKGALLWGWMGGVAVATPYPFAFSRLWRETRSTLGNALMCGRGWIADSNG